MTVFALMMCAALASGSDRVYLKPPCNSLVCQRHTQQPATPAVIFSVSKANPASPLWIAEVMAEAPEHDPWFGVDKVKHFTMSFFVQSAAYAALRGAKLQHGEAVAGASLATLAAGLGKEFRDQGRGRGFSVRDLLWDLAGGAAGALLVSHSQR